MDELLKQEGGQELQFLLDGGDETGEKNVVKLDEHQTQQQDAKDPKQILPLAETKVVDELFQPVSNQQAGRSCEAYY